MGSIIVACDAEQLRNNSAHHFTYQIWKVKMQQRMMCAIVMAAGKERLPVTLSKWDFYWFYYVLRLITLNPACLHFKYER